MAGRYAADTEVSITSSQLELERTLERYGATSFMRGWDQQKVAILFEIAGRRVRLVVPLPDKADFARTEKTRKYRSESSQHQVWEQACRQRWRALNLVVKAKLEAVECGISTIENEFMANILLPNGQQVGDWMKPQLAAVYESGHMPPLLPEPTN